MNFLEKIKVKEMKKKVRQRKEGECDKRERKEKKCVRERERKERGGIKERKNISLAFIK